MNKEIERKWLVSQLPETKPRKHRRIETFYLVVTDKLEVRVQRKQKIVEGPTGINLAPPKFKITVKYGNGIERIEEEVDIDESTYYELRHGVTTFIHKDWFLFPLNDGHELEISVVDGKWMYAEIEFASVAEANAFAPFDFLREHAKEVTGDPAYAMKNYYKKRKEQENA